MSVEMNKEKLCINQIIGKKIDTAIIEEDFVVPDIKPDIINAISTSGTVCIYKKEVMDGKIKIDGCINAYIVYLADDADNGIRGMNVNSNFTKVIDLEKAKTGMILESNAELKSIECKVINGRKICLKSIIEFDLRVSSNEEFEFVKEIEGIKNIQCLTKNIMVDSLVGTGNSKVYAKDTLVIDSIDDLAEIIDLNTQIKNKETKISYNKVLIKADMEVKIVYLTQDNRINTACNIIPVMGFVDMPNVSDENMCDTKYEIKNILIKPNSTEEHSIYVEAEIEVYCNTYEKKEMSLIQDLYSPAMNIAYKQKNIKAMSNKQTIKDICSIREKYSNLNIGNNKIYSVNVKTIINNKTILKDRIMLEGDVELKLLFNNGGNNILNVQNIKIPFTHNMECQNVTQNSEVEIIVETLMQDFVVATDGTLETKIDLQLITNISNTTNINVIEEIKVEENRHENEYSIIVYFVKPGDTLWNIAKKFKSTVSDITQINDIKDENKIDVGMQLFVPLVNY